MILLIEKKIACTRVFSYVDLLKSLNHDICNVLMSKTSSLIV